MVCTVCRELLLSLILNIRMMWMKQEILQLQVAESGSVVHSENLPKVSWMGFSSQNLCIWWEKQEGKPPFLVSLINAAQRWISESQLDKESHDFKLRHQQLNLIPRLFQTPGGMLYRFGNIIGTSMVQSISIWFCHSLRSAKTETLIFTCFNQVSTYKTTSQHESHQDTRW